LVEKLCVGCNEASLEFLVSESGIFYIIYFPSFFQIFHIIFIID